MVVRVRCSAIQVRAERILNEVDSARAEAVEFSGLERGRIIIAAEGSLVGVDVSSLICEFHARYPGVEVLLREDNRAGIGQMLTSGEADVAFVVLVGGNPPPGLTVEPLLIVELALIVSRTHPLASKQGPVTLADLRDERLIARPGSALSEALRQATGAHCFAPHVAIETSDFRLVYPFVAEGLGLAVVPRSAVEYDNYEVALLPIGPAPITRTVALAWATDRYLTPAMRGFLALVSSRPGVPSRA